MKLGPNVAPFVCPSSDLCVFEFGLEALDVVHVLIGGERDTGGVVVGEVHGVQFDVEA